MWLTRNNITKAYGGHGDEAEVECLEEAPLLVVSKDVTSAREEHSKGGQGSHSHDDIGTQAQGCWWPGLATKLFSFSVFFL